MSIGSEKWKRQQGHPVLVFEFEVNGRKASAPLLWFIGPKIYFSRSAAEQILDLAQNVVKLWDGDFPENGAGRPDKA